MTEWFDKYKPGSDVAIGKDEPVVLVGANHPDWIRLPAKMGGTRHMVVKSETAKCPLCPEQHLRHQLDNGVYVYECTTRNEFLWCAHIASTKEAQGIE